MQYNEDLGRERKNATFDPMNISLVLYGGKENLQNKRLAQQRAVEDPDFKIAEHLITRNREDVYDETVRMACQMILKSKQYGYEDDEQSKWFFTECVFTDSVHPFGLQTSMFKPTIKSQATEEQQRLWLPKCESMEMIGTYAQTEIGHGTFIRGLETTATYDAVTEQFVMHSPTITSIKFWPGGLGCTCNHAIVMAQLYIKDKCYGIHLFMVQLRSMDDHSPLPGIELGDINKKFGYDNLDNGYLRFHHHAIPRTNMLMKYAQVSPSGEYTRQAIPQLAYLSMVLVRSLIVVAAANDLGLACTIATRYSAVRRQTANLQGVEPQILDYQTQQLKLFPAIASAYAFIITGFSVRQTYLDILHAVGGGDISRLAELHNLTACLKALSTDMCTTYIEQCRRACGGHGYSQASGLPKIYVRVVPSCTYEGENTVLYLQSARSAMKFYGKAQAGEPMQGTLSYLRQPLSIPAELSSAVKFSLPLYEAAYQLNALRLIAHCAGRLQSAVYGDGIDPETAWNNNSLDLVEAAKAQALYYTAQMFINKLSDPSWEPQALAIMSKLCELFLVHNILDRSGSFLQNGVLTTSQVALLADERIRLLQELRPNAVALVDALDYPDRLLNSCLGRYDGNVYEALYNFAKSSELNDHKVSPVYQKYIKPMQQALKSKL